MSKAKKNKSNLITAIFVILIVFASFFCGGLLAGIVETYSIGYTPTQSILFFVGVIIVFYVGIYIQLIMHEAGHLVFGLLTGYKFSSFRIGSFMLVKANGKLSFKKFSLAGTGGQCLMCPPDIVDGKLPVMLYNLGGSIMNIMVSLVCLWLYFHVNEYLLIAIFLIVSFFIGIFYAMINGIPMKTGNISNDGKNAIFLNKNKDALFAFWMQLKVNELTTKGVRLKDMPDEWFTIPSDEDMKNVLIAAKGVFTCNRMMDEHHFAEADETMEHLLKIDSGIVGVHRSLMICDRMYCEIVGENRKEIIDKMLTKQQTKLMKSMKGLLNVIRTEYAYALLAEKDMKKAEAIKTKFEKRCKTYPYDVDIESERELIAIADQIANSSPVER